MFMIGKEHGQCKSFQSARGVQMVNMRIQDLLPPLLFLLAVVLPPSKQIFNTNRQPELFDVVYPPQAQSERGLPLCTSNTVCNVLLRRFWFRMRIQRLCRCPHRSECPMEWSGKRDNYTMSLNNRSQLKFCNDVTELPQCAADSQAIKVITQTVRTVSTSRTVFPISTMQTNVLATCNCPPNHYWKFHERTDLEFPNGTSYNSTVYTCIKLHKCDAKEFCGNMRADYFFTYYQCSCPHGLMCLQNDSETRTVHELLYTGSAYRAICTQN